MASSKKVKRCFVPVCENSSENSSKMFINVSHKQSTHWFKAVGRPYIPKSVSGYYCCEDHFDMDKDCENWQAFKLMRTKIIMKPDIVPHKHIEKTGTIKEFSQLSNSAKKRKKTNIDVYAAKKNVCKKLEFEEPLCSTEVNQPILDKSLGNIRTRPVSDKGVQVTRILKSIGVNTPRQWLGRQLAATIKHIHVTESSLEDSSPSLKGSTTNDSTETSVSEGYEENLRMKNVRLKQTFEICRDHSKFYLGLPENTYFLVGSLEKHSKIAAVNILIILKKIRLNDPYYRLAIDFDSTVSTISKTLHTFLPILAKFCRSMIIWPPAEQIKLNLPIPFRRRYKEVQSIIDCFEIQIEKPSNPLHQSLTWSEYKKCNTLKYLISCLPDGPINYISVGFGGRITDNEIVQQSEFLNILPNGCHVMADRGFKQIETLLKQKNCTLIRPPSVSKNIQSNQSEVRESKRIAGLRILIERVIGRLREFDFLKPHACIDNHLISKTDDMVVIACGLVNMDSSLFAK